MKRLSRTRLDSAGPIAVLLLGMFVTPQQFIRGADVPRQFTREISTPPRTQDELLGVSLDSDIYAVSQENFADLQVLDATGQTIPYLIRQPADPAARTVQRSWLAENPSLKVLENEGLEITIQLDEKDPHPNGLRIVTPLRNFEQRLQVFGLAEGEPDRHLVTDGLIFDYAKYMDVRQHDIRLPTSSHRKFRIVIERPTADQESQLLELSRQLRGQDEAGRTEQTTVERRPFRIDRIEFWKEEQQTLAGQLQGAAYPPGKFAVNFDDKSRQTIIEVESRREPLTEFRVVTSTRNFSRTLRVEIPVMRTGKIEWQEIAQATISKIHFRDQHEEHLKVTFPHQRQNTYRLAIDNADNAPIKIDGIGAYGPIDQLIFLANAEGNYRLEYGANVEELPRYDTAVIRTSLSRNIEPLPATLGPARPAPDAGKEPDVDLKSTINNPWILGTIVVVLVGLLGSGLYFAARRLDQHPEQEA